MKKQKVLVAGATGNQGGAVVKALLNDGHEVIGITRNTNSAKATKLAEQGVSLISVDFTDKSALVEAMKDVDVVFSMTTPFEGGLDVEIKQGKTMADAAKEAGIGHFIFNSVADADRSTGIPHFDSKYEVEKHIVALNIPHTIVAPVYFMDNLFFPQSIEGLKNGVIQMAMPHDRVLQQIAAEDIGNFVATVVNDGEKAFGKRINIAGDELTGDEMAKIMTDVTGRTVRYEGFDAEQLKSQSEDLGLMFEWFNKEGYTADLIALNSQGLMTFEAWAKKQSWI